jgi:hypothetical protein
MVRPLLAAALTAASLAPLGHAAAQARPARPAAWRTVLDSAGAPESALAFSTMPPGWHVTAGPGGVLYDPANGAAGSFRVASQLFLFSSTPAAGLGVVVGGEALDGRTPRYTAFIVGPDGRYRVTRREGATVRDLVPWTAHPAIARHPGGDENVKATLAVVADSAAVRFEVNGAVVTELPRAAVQPDGVVGLRVDPGVNAHVATLALGERNVAPVPSATKGQ